MSFCLFLHSQPSLTAPTAACAAFLKPVTRPRLIPCLLALPFTHPFVQLPRRLDAVPAVLPAALPVVLPVALLALPPFAVHTASRVFAALASLAKLARK